MLKHEREVTIVQTPTKSETISIEQPTAIALYLTPEQFEAIANRGLRLERPTDGELIVNPPTGWETGRQNWQISGQLYVWWRNSGNPGKAFDSYRTHLRYFSRSVLAHSIAMWLGSMLREQSTWMLAASHLSINRIKQSLNLAWVRSSVRSKFLTKLLHLSTQAFEFSITPERWDWHKSR